MIPIDAHVNALLDATPDAMVVVNALGAIVYVNARTEALFGYTRNELVGQQVEVLLPNRMHAAHPAQRESYVSDPHMRRMGDRANLRARHRDGTEFEVDIHLSPLKTADGLLIFSAIRDVSTHRPLPTKNILLIQNDSIGARLIREALIGANPVPYSVEMARRCSEAIARLTASDAAPIDAIIADIALVDSYGIETFKRLFNAAPQTPILLLCYAYTEVFAQQAMLYGRGYYLLKESMSTEDLLKVVSKLTQRSTAGENASQETQLSNVARNSIKNIGNGSKTVGD